MFDRTAQRREKKGGKRVEPSGDSRPEAKEFSGVAVDDAEYQQICANLVSYFELLQEWSDKERTK